MKYLAILFGACLGLAGCVVETSGPGGNGGGTAGNGGAGVGGGGNGGEGGAGVGGGGSTATGGSGGGTTTACLTCGEFITEEGDLCEASVDIYNELVACTCEGACMDLCIDNVCTGEADPTPECQGCVLDETDGCGTAYQACANDI